MRKDYLRDEKTFSRRRENKNPLPKDTSANAKKAVPHNGCSKYNFKENL